MTTPDSLARDLPSLPGTRFITANLEGGTVRLFSADQMHAYAREAIRLAALAQGVYGYVLVPRKITEAMCDACHDVPSGIAGSPPHPQHVWDAMLSAAPAPAVSEDARYNALLDEFVEANVKLSAAEDEIKQLKTAKPSAPAVGGWLAVMPGEQMKENYDGSSRLWNDGWNQCRRTAIRALTEHFSHLAAKPRAPAVGGGERITFKLCIAGDSPRVEYVMAAKPSSEAGEVVTAREIPIGSRIRVTGATLSVTGPDGVELIHAEPFLL